MLDYPKVKEIKFKEVIHGKEIIDNYRWLENNKDADTKKFIKEQNKLAEKIIDRKIKDRFKKTFKKLFNTELCSSFSPKKGRYFYNKRNSDQEYFVFYYREGLDGKDVVLIDPNTMSKDKSKAIGWTKVSKDGKFVAFGITSKGSDRMPFQILDIENNKILPDKLPLLRYVSVAWLEDSSGFYYSKWPEKGIEKEERDLYHVYFHKLGTNYENDVPLFGKGLSNNKFIDVNSSENNLIINILEGWSKSEIYIKDLKKGAEIIPLITGKDGWFNIIVYKNKAFVMTNYKAYKCRIISFNLDKINENNWEEIIPESNGIIESFDIINNKLVLNYSCNAFSSIKIFDLSGKILDNIELPTLGSVDGIYGEKSGNELFFNFESFIYPPTIYRYDFLNKKLDVIYQTRIEADLSNIKLSQVFYESKDKTKVSMFIIYNKNIKLDGNNPLMLYGYGGFNVNMIPYFSFNIIPFINDGGIYTIPNLRGGGEYGEDWHKQGMLENKQNTFDDFISATEFLINNKYTNKNKIAIVGGSNGGLLVGACVTQRPDLFRVVLCKVPVLDMLRFHKFDGGSLWIPEYGCADNKKDFNHLLKYSPYHNVKKTNYPSIMFSTADTDTRVNPMHARKMAALMQKLNTSSNPIILKTGYKAGHGFGKSKTKIIDSLSDDWAFVYHELNIKN